MNEKAYAYVCSVIAVAMVVIVGQPWAELTSLSARDSVGLLAFTALGVLAEAVAIDFSVGSTRKAKSSIAFLPILACSLTFPLGATLVAVAFVELFTDLIIRRRAAWLVGFNAAQGVLAIFLAVQAYSTLGGIVPAVGEFNFIAFAGLAITFFAVNIILVAFLYTIRQSGDLLNVVKGLVGPNAGNLFYGVLASPVAVFAAILYDYLYIVGLLLMILPLLLIRFSYLSNVQLQQANRDLLRVLIKTIETRDPYTSGHSVRVSNLAKMVAGELGLPKRTVDATETAGLLHDIGKIESVYSEIIQKPSDLTEEEHKVIKTHAVKGAELLRSLTSFSDEVINGVLYHHEHYDGSGYPCGLVGKSIPIVARIIMLCDSIDAMLSDRPYRPALTVGQVQEELMRCAGSQFDPTIVDVIVRSDTLHRALALIKSERVNDVHGLAGTATFDRATICV